jgi:hypothetical protein
MVPFIACTCALVLARTKIVEFSPNGQPSLRVTKTEAARSEVDQKRTFRYHDAQKRNDIKGQRY